MSRTPSPQEWQTHAEQTEYRETPRYAETIAFAKRLAAVSPLIEFQSFGRSGEGRELPLLIACRHETFSPDAAKKAGKPVVLIQACIHAGEPDGKDAGFALLRDIAVTETLPSLLEHVVVLFIPIYNADGHERFGPYNRINQNGPSQMGWRTTSTYQNLNRDYMKVDTPETRAWLALWNKWEPDLFIDCHVTDGADYRYNITYHFEHHEGIDPQVLAWERAVIDGKVKPATEAAGNVVSWYLEFKDNRDFLLGIADFSGSPRFSTGYTPLWNRPGILIETHMLKNYRSRVLATYDFLRFTLEEVNRSPESLLQAVKAADKQTVSKGMTYDPVRRVPVKHELTDQARPYELKALEYRTEPSSVSGDFRVIFGTEPLDLTVPMFDTFRVKAAIAPPLYYIVPVQWSVVIEVLQAHCLDLRKLIEGAQLEIESYRFEEVSWPSGPFEGRQMPTFQINPVRELRFFPAGSVIVPLAQKGAKVAINLLEPQAPDSLAAWGFFNAVFEHKEYAEEYILEELARDMLAKHSGLREEFQHRLATAPSFATPHERLQFFYQRSPYWDPQRSVYPVGRVLREILDKTEAY
jgi:murein tripeptide amidase MpaA